MGRLYKYTKIKTFFVKPTKKEGRKEENIQFDKIFKKLTFMIKITY